MRYMGSKNRIAKHILPLMLSERKDEQWWVEPFVGGANMIDKVNGKRIGNDNHKYLIALLCALQDGWVPPTEISEVDYRAIKDNPDGYPDCLVGFTGFLCSFGGKWWGGYARDAKGNNYAARGSRVLVRQAENLNGVKFRHGSYLDLSIPDKSLIYCDPPYEGTTKYKDSFNHEEFWHWCRIKAKQGHNVFVSGYHAPADFSCLKVVNHYTILNRNNGNKRVEKLFRWCQKSTVRS
jgi:DNA adenine methylase